MRDSLCLLVDRVDEWLDVGIRVAACKEGVGGPEDEGEMGSVIHILCDFVATSFATVCASVGQWCDVEHRKGIFSFVHAASREDDGYEVDASVSEEWQGGGLCEQFHIHAADIA